VASLLPDDLKLAGLLHDATEAYLVDIPRPVKLLLPDYKDIEHNLANVISQRFTTVGTPWLDFDEPNIKEADNLMLVTEAAYLLGPRPASWDYSLEDIVPLDMELECLSPAQAKCRFIDTFTTIYHARNLYV
jgi:hypothetical protein